MCAKVKSPTIYSNQQSQRKDWFVLEPKHNEVITGNYHYNKLLFSDSMPPCVINRATRVHPPVPIMIEKLLPLSEERDNVASRRSSISFTALSEESLQAAIFLAKRDVRRRHKESLVRSPAKPSDDASVCGTSDAELLEELAATPSKAKLKTSSPKEKTSRPAKQAPQRRPLHPTPRFRQSPPCKDTGPCPLDRDHQTPLNQEIYKLQFELQRYIQKVEEMTNRVGETEELLDPQEEKKLELRREKQTARSARMIYVLQQQVKEIQEEMEKLRGKTWHTKKSLSQSTAVNRLAAAHRGTLRVLQDLIQQLSDPSLRKMPPHHKELNQLIHQLCLCSAKVDVAEGSAVPETTVDILQKLQTLGSALRKQETRERVQAQTCPPHRKSPHRSVSPTSVLKGPSASNVRGPRKPVNPRRGVRVGRRMTSQKTKAAPQQLMNRREVLRCGVEKLVHQRGRPQTNTTSRRGPHSDRARDDVITKRSGQAGGAGFQQPTVSSQLRVNEPPQKENPVPWIPTSPHSPPAQRRSPQRHRPEPRCLFSPVKPSENTAKTKEPLLSSEKEKQAQNEAVRNAWLDKMTMQRLKDLNQLSKEEAERIHRLRSEAISPTQWAERAEQEARDRIQPLLDQAQIGQNRISSSLRHRHTTTEQLSEDQSEDRAQAAWAADTRLQAPPTLETMLLRMEQIQRDQEEVRRRFASITYSDPLYWDQPGGGAGDQRRAVSSTPASPQPIRLTRPVLTQSSAAEIVLEKPVETGFVCEDSQTEAGDEHLHHLHHQRNTAVFPGPVQRNRQTVLSVPGGMLGNILKYRREYDAYLHVVAHEDVGSFNPWTTANSLAEDFLSEALDDVAAEFQDVVEDYAEAVFTSEFLQPTQSRPHPAAAAAVFSH
ncbi:protein moonraker isoform X2 [Solea solea]|uniref:protein moonraker isoform X2 n=1 Tax=Solea solea TaxID=90069 RepID=UPI00272A0DB5|nr:protein moonraker isoform X2 [Solea solea]